MWSKTEHIEMPKKAMPKKAMCGQEHIEMPLVHCHLAKKVAAIVQFSHKSLL